MWRSFAIVNFSFSICSAQDFASFSARRSARFRRNYPLLRSGQRFALRRESSARSRKRGRERIGSAWHAGSIHNMSRLAARYPAACGRHVCCGMRQSMPSSR